MTLDRREPVMLRKEVMNERHDLEHYRGATGRITWVSGNFPEHAMVFWPALHCSSMWAIRELRNATGTEIEE